MRDEPPPYRTLAFDCDSTVSALEGIDELARLAGVDVAPLTERAMAGELPLEEVYEARLALVRPGAAELAALGRAYVARLLPGAAALCAALRALDKRVTLVSGGLRPALEPLARALGVPDGDLFAVGLELDPEGRYADFERSSPLARAGGKLELARELAREGPLALVGDGATDLEAAPACARFVAFAGVTRRPAVWEAARARCATADFAALLPLLVSPEEGARLAALDAHAPLVARARTLAARAAAEGEQRGLDPRDVH